MSGFFKFLTIFKTNLIQEAPQKIISDPVKIEFFKEARSYKVPFQLSSVFPKGENGLISKDATLVLNKESHHIALTVRTKETNPYRASKMCEDEIDRIITILSIIYKPEIFSDLIYRGWLLEERKAIMEAWIKVSEKISVHGKPLSDKLMAIKKKQSLDLDILDRFKLMSRFYSKSLALKPNEEKFILLWTILEIFPMKNTINIKPTSEHLATITGRQPEKVKEKLGIGRLYGLRCDLVHNGRLNIDIKEIGEVFSRLENIVLEILRNMSGLPYSRSLDKYL